METKNDSQLVHFSNEASVRASFADYLKNNEIDRNKLVIALNASEMICDGNGKKITLSPNNLNKAFADIDAGNKRNYKIQLPKDLGNILEKYPVLRTTKSGSSLTSSQILIFESLLLYFEAEFQNHEEVKNKNDRLKLLYSLKGNYSTEIKQLQDEIYSLTTRAIELFAQELQKTEVKIHENVFIKLYDFFSISSLLRDMVLGTLVGLLAVSIIMLGLLFSVGTAGIGPLVLGTSVGAVGTGFSLVAIGIGIVGFFTASFAVVGAYFRSETPDFQDKQTISSDMPQVKSNNQLAGIMSTETNLMKPPKIPVPVPEPINKEFFLQPKPSTKFEKMYKRLYKEWDEQSGILINYLLRLESQVNRNFRIIISQLVKELKKDIFSTESFNKNFKDFEDFIIKNQEYATDPKVIELFDVFKRLTVIRAEYDENKQELNGLHELRLRKQAANAAQEFARRDFNEWLQKATSVSKQRIVELYPDEKDQMAMLNKCARLGIDVVDSSNKDENKHISHKLLK